MSTIFFWFCEICSSPNDTRQAYTTVHGAVTLSRGTIAFQNMQRMVRAMLTVREFSFCKNSSILQPGALDCGKFIAPDYASALSYNWRRDFARPLSAIYLAMCVHRFARGQAFPFVSDQNLRSVCNPRVSEILIIYWSMTEYYVNWSCFKTNGRNNYSKVKKFKNTILILILILTEIMKCIKSLWYV